MGKIGILIHFSKIWMYKSKFYWDIEGERSSIKFNIKINEVIKLMNNMQKRLAR